MSIGSTEQVANGLLASGLLDSQVPSIDLRQLLSGFAVDDLPDITVRGVCSDSRLARDGEVYVALRGHTSHGLDYLDQVLERDIPAVLVDADDPDAKRLPARIESGSVSATQVVRIENLAQALGKIAARCYGHPSRQLPVCGITGTDGKTSVSRFVVESLEHLGRRVGYIGTIGWGLDSQMLPNPLTTPDPVTLQRMLLQLKLAGAEFIAIEVSSHALDQGRVNGVEFDVAALTNLGRDHLDYHQTLEAYREAKQRLFDWPNLKAIVVNADDSFGRQLSDSEMLKTKPARQLLRYTTIRHDTTRHNETQHNTTQAEAATLAATTATTTTMAANDPVHKMELHAGSIAAVENGLQFTLSLDGSRYSVESKLLGTFNVQNLLACAGILVSFGIESGEIVAGLQSIKPVPGRMECFAPSPQSADSVRAVVDYAHTPQALESALLALRLHCAGSLWVVFGCGGDRDKGKRPLMGEVACRLADQVVITDDNPRSENSASIIRDILAGIDDLDQLGSRIATISDRKTAIEHALARAAADDWVLVAGKGHEDYQLVGAERLQFSDRDLVSRWQEAGGQ